MLIASYGLVLHGGGVWRLKAGFQYVAINIVASTLFLFAVGLIYGVTGTLNMADLALKVRALAEGDHALLRTGALLLFTVFALKCALVPLHWWLPSAYAAAPAPAVALFAILSKVGAYAVIRMHTLAFAEDAAGVSTSLQTLLFWAATVTVLVGAIGVLASRSILGLAAYSIIGSMGTLLIVAAGLEPRQLSRPPHQAALREPLAEDIRVIAWACAFALTAVMLAMLFSLYRLLAGPATTDRILALDTLVINAIAAVVLMGVVWGTTMYFEVAVLFAMVAFLSTIALCKYLMHGDIIECAHSWLSLSKQ